VFRYVIVGILRDGAPRHGYAVMKAYRQRTGIQIGTGNFYRELQRLVREGLVSMVPRLKDADARQAPYAITPEGAATFDRWFSEPKGSTVGPHYEDQLSARILFLGQVTPETASRVLQKCQDDLWLRAKVLERMRDVALASERADDSFPALQILLSRRLRHVAADLAVLDEVRASWMERSGAKETAGAPGGAAAVAGEPAPRVDERRRARRGTARMLNTVARPGSTRRLETR